MSLSFVRSTHGEEPLVSPIQIGNRDHGSIFSSDIDGLLYNSSGKATLPQEHKQLVLNMLDIGMDMLARETWTRTWTGCPLPVRR